MDKTAQADNVEFCFANTALHTFNNDIKINFDFVSVSLINLD